MESIKLYTRAKSGSFHIFARFWPVVTHSSVTISPDTCRTAIEVFSGPRIKMPSISACPPIDVFS